MENNIEQTDWQETEILGFGWRKIKILGITFKIWGPKMVKRYCATGLKAVRCWVFYGDHWLCVGRNEYHWRDACFGIPIRRIDQIRTVCRKKVPEFTEGCKNAVGDTPPVYVPPVTNMILGTLIGSVITLAILGTHELPTGMTIGAITGIVASITTRTMRSSKCGCALTFLIVMTVVFVVYLLRR